MNSSRFRKFALTTLVSLLTYVCPCLCSGCSFAVVTLVRRVLTNDQGVTEMSSSIFTFLILFFRRVVEGELRGAKLPS